MLSECCFIDVVYTCSLSRPQKVLWHVVGSSCWRRSRRRAARPGAARGWCGWTRSWLDRCLSPSERRWSGLVSSLNPPSDTEGEKPGERHLPVNNFYTCQGSNNLFTCQGSSKDFSFLLYSCARCVACVLGVVVNVTRRNTNEHCKLLLCGSIEKILRLDLVSESNGWKRGEVVRREGDHFSRPVIFDDQSISNLQPPDRSAAASTQTKFPKLLG